MVMQRPSFGEEIDGRFGIFNDRPVLDIAANDMPTFVGFDADLFERRLSQQGIGPDPKSRTEVGEALVHEILNIGGGSGGSLQYTRGVGEGAIGRLSDGHPRVVGLFHQSDQRAGVVGFQQAVGIERNDVGRIGDQAAAGL